MAKFLHILVVDADPDVREVIRLMLSELGNSVSTAEGIGPARRMLDRLDIDLLLCDEMPNDKGRELSDYARSLSIPTLMMSASEESKARFEQIDVGFIGKPFRLKTFRDQVQRVLEDVKGFAGDC